MAQVTTLQPYGVPGRTRSFSAKTAAASVAIHILSTALIAPEHVADSGNNLLVAGDIEVQGDGWFDGLTVTGNSVLGLNSAVFQPAAGGDSTTFFQILDADGDVVGNWDTTNKRLGIGTVPNAPLEVKGSLPGEIGGFYSGLLHVTTADDSEFANSVITGHNSYNTNTQLWYLGSVAGDNNDIAFINRQDGDLSLWTNNIERLRIDSNGTLAFIGTAGLPYGGMFLHSGGVTIDCVGGNFVKITGLGSVGLLNNVTYNASALRVDVVGVYKVSWSCDGDAASANKDFEFAVHLNETEVQQGSAHSHSAPTAGDEFSVASSCLIDVTSTAHDIDLRVRNITDDTDIDILDLSFNIIQIGGT